MAFVRVLFIGFAHRIDGDDGTRSDGDNLLLSARCVLDAISKKYAMRIVGLLGTAGPTRYSEIGDRLAAASSLTLSNHLEELVDRT